VLNYFVGDHRAVFTHLAQFEESLQNYEGALEYYTRALQLSDTDKEMHLRRGI